MMFLAFFITAFVGFAAGAYATREFYKGRVIRLHEQHSKEMSVATKAAYRNGWDSGAYFARNHHKIRRPENYVDTLAMDIS